MSNVDNSPKTTIADDANVVPIEASALTTLSDGRRRVTLADELDPREVLKRFDYWRALAEQLPPGSKFELTNHKGSFLWEVWVRLVESSPTRGVWGILFQQRVVWLDDADPSFAATGKWEIQQIHAGDDRTPAIWCVYDPHGVPYPAWFATEDEARSYRDKAAPAAAQ
jgi:hypothetical protein